MTKSLPTLIPPLLSRGIVELQVDLAVLAGLGSVFAVCCGLMSFVVDLCTKCMSELLCCTATFLTQIVAFSEVLTQVFVITVDNIVKNIYISTVLV